MKVIIPEFVLSVLASPTCDLVSGREEFNACDLVVIDNQGHLDGDLEGTEVVMLPWGLPQETVERVLGLPSVRWVQTMTAGIDHALRALPPGREVVITNASGVFDVPIAEMVLTYILTMAKRIPEFLAQQREKNWHLLRLREVAGLTVGIVGLGGIGGEIAARCQALGMTVVATRRHPERGGRGVDRVLGSDQLYELLAMADYVVVATPLTEETRGLIDAEALRQMRPDAVLINIARGAIVDEAALVAALQEGIIGGAALDVFEQEPLPPSSPFWGMPNVLVTPHNSWSTPQLRTREAALFLDNLARYVHGQPLRNVVDQDRGY
ncbi:MAG: D-2-hydroxyacid dehydrogenase [Anaerolineae bacterium]|nr:D-2-hydroxyacid dehydrogenase [Anaerolineae bacterium]